MKQNTEQLKKIEEIKKAVLDIVYTHLKVTGVKEVENQTYEEYICKGDLVQDLCDYITKTTPHLISSDEIKREAVMGFVRHLLLDQWKEDFVTSGKCWEENESEIGWTMPEFKHLLETYLTQSKEGGTE